MTDFHTELQVMLAGETTSDDAIKKEIIRKIIYKESDLMSVGTKVIPSVDFGDLDIKYSFPSEITAEYPVPEGGNTDIQKIVWTDFDMTLEKGEAIWMITDEAKLRQLENYQMDTSRKRASEAIARVKDGNIMTTLLAGFGGSKTLASGDEWDAAGGDPATDIVDAITWILDNSNILESDFSNMSVAVPTSVYAQLLKLQTIQLIKTSLKEYLKESYDLKFHPTRSLTDNALVVVNSEQTAVHGVLNTNKIPMVEEERKKGVGTEYLIRQYFATKIVPESSTQSTSNRIYKIINVKA